MTPLSPSCWAATTGEGKVVFSCGFRLSGSTWRETGHWKRHILGPIRQVFSYYAQPPLTVRRSQAGRIHKETTSATAGGCLLTWKAFKLQVTQCKSQHLVPGIAEKRNHCITLCCHRVHLLILAGSQREHSKRQKWRPGGWGGNVFPWERTSPPQGGKRKNQLWRTHNSLEKHAPHRLKTPGSISGGSTEEKEPGGSLPVKEDSTRLDGSNAQHNIIRF